jgi:hypothetical protein
MASRPVKDIRVGMEHTSGLPITHRGKQVESQEKS